MWYDFAFIDFISYIMSFFDSLSKFYHTTIPFPFIHTTPSNSCSFKSPSTFCLPFNYSSSCKFCFSFYRDYILQRKLDPDRIFPSNLASDTEVKSLLFYFYYLQFQTNEMLGFLLLFDSSTSFARPLLIKSIQLSRTSLSRRYCSSNCSKLYVRTRLSLITMFLNVG